MSVGQGLRFGGPLAPLFVLIKNHLVSHLLKARLMDRGASIPEESVLPKISKKRRKGVLTFHNEEATNSAIYHSTVELAISFVS